MMILIFCVCIVAFVWIGLVVVVVFVLLHVVDVVHIPVRIGILLFSRLQWQYIDTQDHSLELGWKPIPFHILA